MRDIEWKLLLLSGCRFRLERGDIFVALIKVSNECFLVLKELIRDKYILFHYDSVRLEWRRLVLLNELLSILFGETNSQFAGLVEARKHMSVSRCVRICSAFPHNVRVLADSFFVKLEFIRRNRWDFLCHRCGVFAV